MSAGSRISNIRIFAIIRRENIKHLQTVGGWYQAFDLPEPGW